MGPKDRESTLPLKGLGSQAGAKGMFFAVFVFHLEHREPPTVDGYTEQGTNSCSPMHSSRQRVEAGVHLTIQARDCAGQYGHRQQTILQES